MIIQFDRAAETLGLAGIEEAIAGAVDDHAVRTAQILPAADEHLARYADERLIVDADHRRDRVLAIFGFRDGIALEQTYSPRDAFDSAHAKQIGFLERLRLLEVLGLRIHHPN